MSKSKSLAAMLAGVVACAAAGLSLSGGVAMAEPGDKPKAEKVQDADKPKADKPKAEKPKADKAEKANADKEAKPPRLFKPFSQLSSLTLEQQQQIAEIRKQTNAKIAEIRAAEREAIMKVLDEQQRAEVEQLEQSAKGGAAKKQAQEQD